MKKTILFGAFALSLFVFDSCKKNEDNTASDSLETSIAQENSSIIESSFEDMTNMTDQIMNNDTLTYYNSPKVTLLYGEKIDVSAIDKSPCNVIVTVDTLSSQKDITIDWGNSNCDCKDGKQRRGKIITTFTGKYSDPGTIIKHTTQDYYVNDNKIVGTRTVTNLGLNSANKMHFSVVVNGGVTMKNGDVYTYNSARNRVWSKGMETKLNVLDDEYEVSGVTTASSSGFNGYTSKIDPATPLVFRVGCPYIVKGKMEFTPTGKAMRLIDFGDGTCDKTLTVTVNGKTYTIN